MSGLPPFVPPFCSTLVTEFRETQRGSTGGVELLKDLHIGGGFLRTLPQLLKKPTPPFLRTPPPLLKNSRPLLKNSDRNITRVSRNLAFTHRKKSGISGHFLLISCVLEPSFLLLRASMHLPDSHRVSLNSCHVGGSYFGAHRCSHDGSVSCALKLQAGFEASAFVRRQALETPSPS